MSGVASASADTDLESYHCEAPVDLVDRLLGQISKGEVSCDLIVSLWSRLARLERAKLSPSERPSTTARAAGRPPTSGQKPYSEAIPAGQVILLRELGSAARDATQRSEQTLKTMRRAPSPPLYGAAYERQREIQRIAKKLGMQLMNAADASRKRSKP